MAAVDSMVAPVEDVKPVDREKTCPLLLRVFCSNIRHNHVSDYFRGNVPPNELQIYTWLDCSLRELMGLIKEVNVEARRPGTRFDFALVRPDEYRPGYEMRDLGTCVSGQRGLDDSKTLSQCKFVIGDFIDVAVVLPQMERRGGPMGMRRGGGMGMGMRDGPPHQGGYGRY